MRQSEVWKCCKQRPYSFQMSGGISLGPLRIRKDRSENWGENASMSWRQGFELRSDRRGSHEQITRKKARTLHGVIYHLAVRQNPAPLKKLKNAHWNVTFAKMCFDRCYWPPLVPPTIPKRTSFEDTKLSKRAVSWTTKLSTPVISCGSLGWRIKKNYSGINN